MFKNKTRYKVGLKEIREGLALTLRFNKYILRYWKIQLAILFLGNISIGLGLVNPYLGKLILDNGILAKNLHSFFIFTLLAGIIFFVSLILSLAYDYLKNYSSVKVEVEFSREVFKKLRHYSLAQLQLNPSAINLFKIINDINSASNIISVTLVHFINALLKIIYITAIIIFINPVLLFIVLAYQIINIIKMKFFLRRSAELSIINLEKSEESFRLLNDFFSHIYLIKAFGTVGREIVRYMHNFFELMKLRMKGARLNAISGFTLSLTDKVFFGAVAFYGSYLVIKGRISLGTMTAALLYISQGAGAYSTFTNMAGQLVMNKISLERVADLLEEPMPPLNRPAGLLQPAEIRGIEFKDVTFGYNRQNPVLKEISFKIEPGAHIGLMGYSGCGKTTLISLILGLYQSSGGLVLVGGEDIQEIGSQYFLNKVGIALQEPFLFNDSIANNIAYAFPGAAPEEISQAASLTGALDFIEPLEQKFNTIVGENAYRLSQGQKQRIAIARAIIKKPQILILDEALSSLDAESEEHIIANLRRCCKDSTIIIVSHRLSAIRGMDKIYFLRGPGVMYSGRHEQLLRQVPEYKIFLGPQLEEGQRQVLNTERL